MTEPVVQSSTVRRGVPPPLAGRWNRVRARRRLAARDRASARLAELHQVQQLLMSARKLVEADWAQEGWFVRRGVRGDRWIAGAFDLRDSEGSAVTGGCLVGAIVHAGGGPTALRSPAVQRALDTVWQTLYRPGRPAVGWCPAPQTRTQQMRELTRWNDHPARARGEVAVLLSDAAEVAGAHLDPLRRRSATF